MPHSLLVTKVSTSRISLSTRTATGPRCIVAGLSPTVIFQKKQPCRGTCPPADGYVDPPLSACIGKRLDLHFLLNVLLDAKLALLNRGGRLTRTPTYQIGRTQYDHASSVHLCNTVGYPSSTLSLWYVLRLLLHIRKLCELCPCHGFGGRR
jgi:hypothetical protein